MAKGNALLGYARGSVGDVTFSRVKGQQVSKARNRKPANPKTKRQMLQRASFINPVKFFTQGTQAFFKFAYSDKKVTESDFNAFQRHNAKASYPVTKAEYDSNKVAPLGRYMMTKGKLPAIGVAHYDEEDNCPTFAFGLTTEPTTIGAISAALISKGWVSAGDIVTIVGISVDGVSYDGGDIDFSNAEHPVWNIAQFVVDASSSVLTATAFANFDTGLYDGVWHVLPKLHEDAGDSTICGLAIAVSRETALGLETSTSYIEWNAKADAYIDLRNTDDEVAKVLTSWGATGEAILQGAIAKA